MTDSARPLQHVVVLHRWQDEYARYLDYLDHTSAKVTYVSTELGVASVPGNATETLTVPTTDDPAAVRVAVAELASRHGRPDRVVALNEGDLDVAAVLRAEWGCSGPLPDEQDLFRDKLVMTDRIARAGIAVPAYADAATDEEVLRFADKHGWPVVVKPRKATASRGVARLDGPDDLARQGVTGAEPCIVQSFVDAPVIHIDGFWNGQGPGPWRASRYIIDNCAGFAQGTALGSVEIDDPRVLRAVKRFLTSVMTALSPGKPLVFHLEAFLGEDDHGRPKLIFLEVGSRVGGAEIPFLWREVHGVDLMAAAAALQLGREPVLPRTEGSETAGWLLVSPPNTGTRKVVRCEWNGGSPDSALYAQVVPEAGTTIPATGGYEHVGARFRFRGTDAGSVEKSIRKTAESFRLICLVEAGLPQGVP